MQENKMAGNQVLDSLKQEVADLKNSNAVAIESFEKSLQELTGLPNIKDLDWSLDSNSIEIFTMEEPPALSQSIREIKI